MLPSVKTASPALSLSLACLLRHEVVAATGDGGLHLFTVTPTGYADAALNGQTVFPTLRELRDAVTAAKMRLIGSGDVYRLGVAFDALTLAESRDLAGNYLDRQTFTLADDIPETRLRAGDEVRCVPIPSHEWPTLAPGCYFFAQRLAEGELLRVVVVRQIGRSVVPFFLSLDGQRLTQRRFRFNDTLAVHRMLCLSGPAGL